MLSGPSLAAEGELLRRYCFKLLWDDRQRWLTPLGLQETPPGQEAQFAVSVPSPYPEWVADQVFYQIFPDRFARSAVAENAPHPRWRDWVTPLDDTVDANTFYGGDLDGITARLPYLQALGITALYLNPIFSAPSNHKYDTADYYRVDAGLGGDQALIRLRQATARVGIRLLLDGVFNHTGDTHRWFDRPRCGEDGACHHPASPQRERYSFDADGRALGWKGEPSLPKLDYASVRVIDSIYRADDSVIRYWLRPPYAIDGWRLDVIHMLGEGEAPGVICIIWRRCTGWLRPKIPGLCAGRALWRRAPLAAGRGRGRRHELYGLCPAAARVPRRRGCRLSADTPARRGMCIVDGVIPRRAQSDAAAVPV